MDNRLQRYLSDHHASASGSLDLIKDLLERLPDGDEKEFLKGLQQTVETDQESLLILMRAANLDQSVLVEMAGTLSSQVSRLKLAWEGLDPGKLGFMEAYEMLATGIQGKRMLWLALGAVAEWFPEWRNVDFGKLEEAATEQREAIEKHLVLAAKASLIDPERQQAEEQTHETIGTPAPA